MSKSISLYIDDEIVYEYSPTQVSSKPNTKVYRGNDSESETDSSDSKKEPFLIEAKQPEKDNRYHFIIGSKFANPISYEIGTLIQIHPNGGADKYQMSLPNGKILYAETLYMLNKKNPRALRMMGGKKRKTPKRHRKKRKTKRRNRK
jgi:hypothetical protein